MPRTVEEIASEYNKQDQLMFTHQMVLFIVGFLQGNWLLI